eukprot:6162545-Pleurochrysis_carterae.AAC.3
MRRRTRAVASPSGAVNARAIESRSSCCVARSRQRDSRRRQSTLGEDAQPRTPKVALGTAVLLPVMGSAVCSVVRRWSLQFCWPLDPAGDLCRIAGYALVACLEGTSVCWAVKGWHWFPFKR